ncbi:MAG: phosphatase PAP2 family protein [Candidatus Limnocylindria bacterium]
MTTQHRSGQVGMALRWPMTIDDVAAFPRRDLRAGSRASTLAIGGAATAVVVLFAIVKANRSAAFDLAVTLRLQRYKSPALARLMAAASWPGFPPQGRVIPPAIIGLWFLAGRSAEAMSQTAAWGAAALATGLKFLARRPRPLPPAVEVIVAPLDGTSFPSGHVLTYVIFYGFMAHLVSIEVRDPLLRRTTVAGLLGLVALVGPSRIVQGHHWATDVAASYLIGLVCLLGLVRLHRRLRERWA